MSLNVEIKSNIHNRFDIFKENVKTGKKEQVGYAENIVTDAMWPRLCSGSTYFVNIHYGTGTGTLSPVRTSLFSHLGTAAAGTVETVRAIPTSYWRRSITLGLTTANGNTLTEVGIAYGTGSTNLVTHAQIRDMNGNPTGIVKTDVDIITIYATVYITLVNDHPSIKLLHPDSNGLLSYLLGAGFPSAVFSSGMSYHETVWPSGSILGGNIGSSGTGSWSADVANKKRTTSTMRFETTVNGHIKELGFSNIARLLLPATGIYAGLELSDVPVGTGDGATDTFDLPSAFINQSTAVVKVDGTPIVPTYTDTLMSLPRINRWGFSETSGTIAIANCASKTGRCLYGLYGRATTTLKSSYRVLIMEDETLITLGSPATQASSASHLKVSDDGTVVFRFGPYDELYSEGRGLPNNFLWSRSETFDIDADASFACFVTSSAPYISAQDYTTEWVEREAIVPVYTSKPLAIYSNKTGEKIIAAYNVSNYIHLVIYTYGEAVWTSEVIETTVSCGSYIYHRIFADEYLNTISCCQYNTLSTEIFQVEIYKKDVGSYSLVKASTYMNYINGQYPTPCAVSLDGSLFACMDTSGTKVLVYEYINGDYEKVLEFVMASSAYDSVNYMAFTHKNALIMSVQTGGRANHVAQISLAKVGTRITFSTPPADGAVITADYTVNGIHKTDQRVIDISGEIQFGEPT